MQWQKKLYQHEELPPPGIWDEMKKILADEPYTIRQSLNEFAVTPPVSIWENVSSQIEQQDVPVSVPFLHKFRRTTLSYAAAIVGIGLFTALLVFLFNNKPNEVGVKDLAAGLNFQDSPLLENKNADNNQDNKNDPSSNESEQNRLIAESQSGITGSKNDNPAPAEPAPVKVNPPLKKPVANSSHKNKNEGSAQKTATQKVSYSDGNYIILYENNGQSNRVSYKLADMVQSLHNNEPGSGTTKESTLLWNKKITEWKEKMGHSTFIPSASNFFDIAEMAEILNSEK
jgi:hypothetical protein